MRSKSFSGIICLIASLNCVISASLHKILPLGDSITCGCGSSAALPPSGRWVVMATLVATGHHSTMPYVTPDLKMPLVMPPFSLWAPRITVQVIFLHHNVRMKGTQGGRSPGFSASSKIGSLWMLILFWFILAPMTVDKDIMLVRFWPTWRHFWRQSRLVILTRPPLWPRLSTSIPTACRRVAQGTLTSGRHYTP